MTSTPGQPTPSGADDLPVPPASSKPAPGGGPTTVPGGPTKRPAGPTTLTGTVVAGVEPGCLLLDQYLLVGGAPAVLRAGARVKVTGRVEAGMVTTCQQGTPFVVETAEPA